MISSKPTSCKLYLLTLIPVCRLLSFQENLLPTALFKREFAFLSSFIVIQYLKDLWSGQ